MTASAALQGVVAGFGGALPLGAPCEPLGVTLGVFVVKHLIGRLSVGASPIGDAAALVAENAELVMVWRANPAASQVDPFVESMESSVKAFESKAPSPISAPLPVFVGELDVVSEFDVVAVRMVFENCESLALVRQPDFAPRLIDARHPVVFGLQGVPRGERYPDLLDAGPVEEVVSARHHVVVPEALRVNVVQRDREEQGHE